MAIILIVSVGVIGYLWLQERRRADRLQKKLTDAHAAASSANDQVQIAQREISALREQLERLRPYLVVEDAKAEAARIRLEAAREAEQIKAEAKALLNESREQARERVEKANEKLETAGVQAQEIIAQAQRRVQEIAGDAYKALKHADHIKGVLDAMRNKIEGYGDRYLEPTYSLLDELADAYAFADAGRQLKLARQRSQLLVDQGRAATCGYVDPDRRKMAIAFVLDAFNGKVDSILSRVRSDNIGTLRQQIRDAFSLVNYNGAAFRDTRISQEYLEARLDELKWAVAVVALRDKEREEQRQIKARIREEERAQREFERAKREAEKEEAAVRKAMERMQGLIARASEEQRAKYESQLAELTARLQEAEAKSQRAKSMAQQTKSGHVYIVSNIGSFGENVYKIGMTRRLDPLDRVRELGDASVPFGFDVHAMIYADDAPKLERELHRKFLLNQVNKVNHRKEFFRVTITEIEETIEALGIQCAWTMAAQAAEYRESLSIEERIKSDPRARQQWLEHQMLLDPVTEDTAVETESDTETA